MDNVQSGILESTPPVARYLIFSLIDQDEARRSLRLLRNIVDGRETIVGFGQSLVLTLGTTVPGLRTAPSYAGAGYEVPSTPFALWCWLRGDDRGELLHRTRRIHEALAPAFRLEQVIDAFTYGAGRDLTGYEDGTENPKDERASEVAFVREQGDGLDGSSFVAVQQWVHDLDHFEAKSAQEQDHAIGRRRSDNDEIEDAPPSAHIKRTAQESFDPAAFVLRRSMPWTDDCRAGLVFVAFGASFDAFEALL
ncbi:MAG: Dyp-type peroxidase, partial [Nitrospirae bacterium]